MRLSNSFLASARLISNNCSSPSMVYEAMKRTMDKTLIMMALVLLHTIKLKIKMLFNLLL